MTWAILCESPDLAVQCLAAAQRIALDSAVSVESDLRAAALATLEAGRPLGLVYLNPPPLSELVEIAHVARARGARVALALPAPSEARRALLDVAAELGLCAVAELAPLAAALALLGAGAEDAFSASARGLAPADRARLRAALANGKGGRGQLIALDANAIGYRADTPPSAATVALGEARDVAEALAALRRTERAGQQVTSSVDDVDARAVLDIIFGPRRALSDPASKAALAPYGIPVPLEELCSSASRAASEAARIGFPVRIALASPTLRIWDHPDLCVDMVDNAARVRDTFRQLQALALSRLSADPKLSGPPEARVLGVLVSATSDAQALLRVHATPLPNARVATEIGFADPHGRAAKDSTITVLPAEPALIERALRRLAGADLLFATSPAQRKTRVESVADVLLRLAAFVNDRRSEIEAVELGPLAILLDGSAEVREACVSVSDFFERA
jgi:hypothetical protein